MKLFIFALALALLFTAHFACAQSEYTTMSFEEADGDTTIQSLKFFGWKFVLEKGIFQSTKFPLNNGAWYFYSTDSTEKRTADGVDYYRFTTRLALDQGGDRMVIRARYVVSNRPSNGKFLVSSWSYTELQNPEIEEEFVASDDEFIDIVPLNSGSSDLSSLLDSAITAVVKSAIEQEALPDASYDLKYVYSAESVYGTTPPTYDFLVSLISSDGNYYRIRFEVQEGDDSEEAPQYEINPLYMSGSQW